MPRKKITKHVKSPEYPESDVDQDAFKYLDAGVWKNMWEKELKTDNKDKKSQNYSEGL